MQNFQEAKEEFGKMLRWTEAPTNQAQAEKTIFIGSVVQGYYNNLRTEVGQNRSNVYEVQLENGELVSFWGSGLLDGKFKEIPMGVMVRVTYLGVKQPQTPAGRAYQDFKVEYDPNTRKPMATAGANLAAPAAAAPVQQQAPVAPAPSQPVAPTQYPPNGGGVAAPSNQGF